MWHIARLHCSSGGVGAAPTLAGNSRGMLRNAMHVAYGFHERVCLPWNILESRYLEVFGLACSSQATALDGLAGKALARYRCFHFHLEHLYVLIFLELAPLNITCSVNPAHIVWKALCFTGLPHNSSGSCFPPSCGIPFANGVGVQITQPAAGTRPPNPSVLPSTWRRCLPRRCRSPTLTNSRIYVPLLLHAAGMVSPETRASWSLVATPGRGSVRSPVPSCA